MKEATDEVEQDGKPNFFQKICKQAFPYFKLRIPHMNEANRDEGRWRWVACGRKKSVAEVIEKIGFKQVRIEQLKVIMQFGNVEQKEAAMKELMEH